MGDRYPPDWDKRRKRVYKRDGYECQKCGAKGGPFGDNELHAHHMVSISDGGSHNLSNLRTLCKSCHESEHGHPIPTGGSSSREYSSVEDISLIGILDKLYFYSTMIYLVSIMLAGIEYGSYSKIPIYLFLSVVVVFILSYTSLTAIYKSDGRWLNCPTSDSLQRIYLISFSMYFFLISIPPAIQLTEFNNPIIILMIFPYLIWKYASTNWKSKVVKTFVLYAIMSIIFFTIMGFTVSWSDNVGIILSGAFFPTSITFCYLRYAEREKTIFESLELEVLYMFLSLALTTAVYITIYILLEYYLPLLLVAGIAIFSVCLSYYIFTQYLSFEFSGKEDKNGTIPVRRVTLLLLLVSTVHLCFISFSTALFDLVINIWVTSFSYNYIRHKLDI